jgi:hypothetical protein
MTHDRVVSYLSTGYTHLRRIAQDVLQTSMTYKDEGPRIGRRRALPGRRDPGSVASRGSLRLSRTGMRDRVSRVHFRLSPSRSRARPNPRLFSPHYRADLSRSPDTG